MRKTTYKEFNRYVIYGNTFYYFSAEEGYEYQKDGIRFYIRKDVASYEKRKRIH